MSFALCRKCFYLKSTGCVFCVLFQRALVISDGVPLMVSVSLDLKSSPSSSTAECELDIGISRRALCLLIDVSDFLYCEG